MVQSDAIRGGMLNVFDFHAQHKPLENPSVEHFVY